MKKLTGYLAIVIAACLLMVGFSATSYAASDSPAMVVVKFHRLSGQKKFLEAARLCVPDTGETYLRSNRAAWQIDGLCFTFAEEQKRYRGDGMAIVVFYLDARRMAGLMKTKLKMSQAKIIVNYARMIMGWVMKYDLETAASAKKDTLDRIIGMLNWRIRRVAQLKLVRGRWLIVKMGW